jgi:hypothetical protein
MASSQEALGRCSSGAPAAGPAWEGARSAGGGRQWRASGGAGPGSARGGARRSDARVRLLALRNSWGRPLAACLHWVSLLTSGAVSRAGGVCAREGGAPSECAACALASPPHATCLPPPACSQVQQRAVHAGSARGGGQLV